MKKLLFLLLLAPLLILSQNQQEYAVLENGLIAVHPAKIKQFEEGISAHNKKYHNQGSYGARVYSVASGPNVGKYIWMMGPQPWSVMDKRPADKKHDDDWNTNVMPFIMAEGGDQTYWRAHPKLSHFPKDFNLNVIKVMMLDVKNFTEPQMMKVLEKVHKVVSTMHPDATFGTYTNELASHNGQDVAWVSFYENMAMMGQPDTFPQDFTHVYGEGSFEKFLLEVQATIDNMTEEIWRYRKDLSGLNEKILAQN